VKSVKVIFCLVLPILVFWMSCHTSGGADLVLRGGKIAAVDDAFSIHQAVAVKGDKIVFVGSKAEVEPYIGPDTEVLELRGRLVLPGLIDAHAHIHSLGEKLTSLNISDTESYEEVVAIVAGRVESVPEGEWIIGGRWDHTRWEGKQFPVHDVLSRVSPDNPVYLSRVDGNSAFVNQKAMDMAGITKETPDPFGGQIIRKPEGEPTGVLINRAMNLVKAHFPEETEVQYRAKVIEALESCLRVGLTGVHEAGIGPEEIEIYKSLIDDGKIHVRVYAMLGQQEKPVLEMEDLADYFKKQRIDSYGHHALSVRSVKLFFDGALGSRGAAFFEPYADDPGNNGLLRITPEYVTRVSRAALEAGMGVNTHCIGIRGNRLCLDAYERALKEHPGMDHRFRIEHAQIVRDEDIAKFTELGVIPSMQPTHCTSDMGFVEERVGKDRARGAYAWRKFLDAGLVIPFGSDFPVESNDPMLGIYAAVTRQDGDGNPDGGWYPDQRMTVEEAIRGFTIWAAYAAFQEDVLGSIEVGKLADFTVLDRDILTAQPKDIRAAKSVLTIIGGQVRYEAEGDL